MAGSILVAYATRYGSTGEVADAVGDGLRERGLDVEIRAMRDVRSVETYKAAVLGSAFYIGSMLKEAKLFLEQHRSSLEKIPVAFFALGPISADEELEEARSQLDQALAQAPWLKPVAAEMFIGKYDPSKLRLTDKLIAALPASPLHGVKARDDRDWDAIRNWTESLPAALNLSN
ncbi:MAG: flavodoxin domain-containing protein [Candidatus Aquicultorales bacterium]